MARPDFQARAYRVTVGDQEFLITKSNSGYGRYYVRDAVTRKYLSQGAATLQGAQLDAVRIANQKVSAS